MAIRYGEDDNGVLTYENTHTGGRVYVWRQDLVNIAEVCQMCHGKKTSPTHRMMSGDYSYRNLARTLAELRRVQDLVDNSEQRINGDDYLDLLTAIEDLDGVVRRVNEIT